MKNIFERLGELCKNRLVILFSCVFVIFIMLTLRLFSLQIIQGEKFQQDLKTSIMNKVSLPASRGQIYDRYGRPLATNQVAFSVKIDDSTKIDLTDKRNKLILDFAYELNDKGTPLTDTLPITKTQPYSFTFKDKETEKTWKLNAGIKKSNLNITPQETLDFLTQKYEIPKGHSDAFKRAVISFALEVDDRNLMLILLINTLEKNGETLVDDLPISNTIPYTFLFDNNENKEITWKQSVAMKKEELNFTAPQTMEYLIDFFAIPNNMPQALTRKAISLKYSLYLERYRKYQPITVALDVSDKTLSSVEENQDAFPGVLIDTDSLRKYPYGEYFSHILGYIRKISEEEYADFKQYKDENGNQIYSNTDIIGKDGIEKLNEQDLNGKDGEMLVEVDSRGRRINTIETKEPVSGKNVFLTLDSELQKKSFEYLESALKDVLINKLTSRSSKVRPITLKQLFISMINANKIPIDKICSAESGEQKAIHNYILQQNPSFVLSTKDDLDFAKQVISDGIDAGAISTKQMVLLLIEQGKLTADEEYLARIQSGSLSPLSVVIQKLESGELRPADTALDPCTGSIVVSKVDSGEVLALVSYPSYDNNELVNNFNNEYYTQLSNDFVTTPMVNRPLKEKKAPGSTFKMITAIAGLETGVITPSSLIRDLGSFTKASKPYAKCWIYGGGGGTHGSINVTSALEQSCNYFFYETAYRMGNAPNGTSLESITTLNDYMVAFGLNDYSGVEIGEYPPSMASAKNKEDGIKWRNPDATTSQTRWVDGDSIRAAIGQSVNNYAPIHINKYIATLANGGTRYKMHLLSKIENSHGTINRSIDEIVENDIMIAPENLNAVYNGMLMVTQGTRGTLRTVFKDFPIDVAAKSGTAQEKLDRDSHAWFVGFAPYDDPQIAITVMIPFGETTGSPSAVIAKNIIAEYMGLNYEPKNNYLDTTLAK